MSHILPARRIRKPDEQTAKHATGYTKAKFKILVVVCKMILFHFPHIARQHGMVKTAKDVDKQGRF